MKVCFDTNIIIDHLNGRNEAKLLFANYEPLISAIVYLEALTKLSIHLEPEKAKQILSGLKIIPVNKEIAELAASIRNTMHLKTPDAVIYATAKHLGLLLLTRNTKDFKESDPYIKVPYRL